MTSPPVPSHPHDERSVGIVSTRFIDLFSGETPLRLESGVTLGPVRVAYETYGQLNSDASNAIYICHALTGDAHVAGRHSPESKKAGWWDGMVGPGKTFDTNKYFVICSNVLGGCQGTTGPGSINPATGQPWGTNFPFITIGDMVEVQAELVRSLGIERLLAVVGGSLGGMMALDWAARFPDMPRAIVCLASSARLTAQGIAFNSVGRRAIYADPNFQNGDYYANEGPKFGLALARMIAHITYLSETSIERKFGRRLQNSDQLGYEPQQEIEFQIESYLHYQGQRFIERFDANCYLYLTRAMDYFDITQRYGSIAQALGRTKAPFFLCSYTSDWLFPPQQSREIVTALLGAAQHVTYLELEGVKGHDSFLLELEQLEALLTPFLTYVAQHPPDSTRPMPARPNPASLATSSAGGH
jgi:homoserine O-acetyltransferase